MTANELRIGNLVTSEYYPDFDRNGFTVDSINKDGINLRVEDDGKMAEMASYFIEPDSSFDKLRPIPLTEEWLLKFGFEKTWEYAYNVYRIGWFAIRGGDNFYYRSVKLEHVHQLQNLYYAVLGKELTLTQ